MNRKGGIASGASRRRKASLKNAAKLIASLPAEQREIPKELAEMEGVTQADLVTWAAFRAAKRGNMTALVNLMRLLDEYDSEVDKREQRARTAKTKADTEVSKAKADLLKGSGLDKAEDKIAKLFESIGEALDEQT